MKYLSIFVICFLLFPVFSVSADEEMKMEEMAPEMAPVADAAAIVEISESKEESAEQKKTDADYIEMDIRTSTLVELAAWCRELGLPEGGAKEELASRLRANYQLPPGRIAEAGQRIITIESAKTTDYFTIEAVDEEYARLKGDVIISLKDGNSVHRIKAWEILYNRTRNVITASGDVVYVKEDGDSIETFKGASITVNLDNWASIFMDGVSERSIAGNTTAYRFAGTVISRNSEEVTVLTGADITNPNNEEAYWSLHASKLWLLPGNDWAILNMVLKVGNIPLLYFPFFYYPADEIVFHPVLGYRSREGTFLQTTTYILGRPKTSVIAENSITKIFGSASDNMEQKREGVFLRNTGEKKVNANGPNLSLLLDAYVNMGFYLGTEFTLPGKSPFGEFTVSAGLGRTRNIYPYPSGLGNTPFLKYDGVSEWNTAKLFSIDSPLRYRFKTGGSFQFKGGSLSWDLPFYSDPYVDRDFMRRTEVLDWLAMLREGASASDEDTAADTYITSYEWRLNGSYTVPVTGLAPYLSSFSFSSISSSMLFSNQMTSNYTHPTSPPNPGERFFFPNRFTIYSLSASLSGTPLTLGAPAAQAKPQANAGDKAPGDALLPDLPYSPWGTKDSDAEKKGAAAVSAGASAAAGADADSGQYSFTPPVLSQRFTLPGSGGPRLSFDYRLTPTTASELQFNSTGWKDQDDIDWGDMSSILTRFRSDGSMGVNLTHSGGSAYSGSFRVSGTGSWQDYLYMNEDAAEFDTDAKIKTAKNRAYNETYFTSSWDFTGSVRPFFQSTVWGNTSLQYNLRGLLAKTTVDTSGDNPEWEWIRGKWNKDDIQTNQATANVSANIMDYNQTLSVSAVLPPKDSSASGNITLRAWISETTARTRVVYPLDEDKRKWEPVYFTETLRFGSLGSFQQYVVYDPDKQEYTTFTSSLSLSGLTASFSAVYSRPWKYDPLYFISGSGVSTLWMQLPDERLEPREFKLGYAKAFTKNDVWNKRISFSANVNTSMTFDLQRYTSSKLSFGLGLNMGIANFLDINLSTSSENVVLYKYFQKLPFYDMPEELYPGQETNFFKDLFNSFRFDNKDLRRKSGFKLKTLNLSLIHHLGDWNASLSMKMSPILDTTTFPYSYKFNNEISFLIQWVPIGEIKTEINYSEEKLTIK